MDQLFTLPIAIAIVVAQLFGAGLMLYLSRRKPGAVETRAEQLGFDGLAAMLSAAVDPKPHLDTKAAADARLAMQAAGTQHLIDVLQKARAAQVQPPAPSPQ